MYSMHVESCKDIRISAVYPHVVRSYELGVDFCFLVLYIRDSKAGEILFVLFERSRQA